MIARVLGGGLSRWVLVVSIVFVAAVCAVAFQQSVVVRAQWRILPYQSLRIHGGTPEFPGASSRVILRAPTVLDLERGYMELENVIRLQVVSNTNWTVQVWAEQQEFGGLPIEAVQLRGSSSEYLELSTVPQVLATGGNGVFELPIDYRIALGDATSIEAGQALEVVYTMLSN